MIASMSQVLRKNPEFFHREVGDQKVQIISLESDSCLWEIDGLALYLWREVDGETDWDSIVAGYEDSVTESEEEYYEHAEEFLHAMLENKILIPA